MKLSCGGQIRDVRIEKDAVLLDARRLGLLFSERNRGALEIWLDGRRDRAVFVRDGERLLVWVAGRTYSFERAAARSARAVEHAGSLASPMPGRLRRTLVKEGERVEKGQVVLVLEAMKMEHAIRAPSAGVAHFFHREGDLVDAGTELAVIE